MALSDAGGWSASLEGKRVLVVGSSGFIGCALAERLSALGASVVGASLHRQKSTFLRTHYAVDITSKESVERLFKASEPEIVIHVAGATNASRDSERVLPTFEANALGTVLLLEASLRYGCRRFVYSGSMEEVRAGVAPPSSPYGASKSVGSMYVRLFREVFSMVTVLVRPFFVYGPGLLHLDKLVPSMIRSVLKGEPAHLKSPHREMDWVYIDDVVEGFVRATALDSAVGREVDLGSGELVSILGVWSVLRDLRPHLPEPVFEHDASRRDEVSPIADTESCVLALGWKPSTSLNVGLARTLEWYSLVDRST